MKNTRYITGLTIRVNSPFILLFKVVATGRVFAAEVSIFHISFASQDLHSTTKLGTHDHFCSELHLILCVEKVIEVMSPNLQRIVPIMESPSEAPRAALSASRTASFPSHNHEPDLPFHAIGTEACGEGFSEPGLTQFIRRARHDSPELCNDCVMHLRAQESLEENSSQPLRTYRFIGTADHEWWTEHGYRFPHLEKSAPVSTERTHLLNSERIPQLSKHIREALIHATAH